MQLQQDAERSPGGHSGASRRREPGIQMRGLSLLLDSGSGTQPSVLSPAHAWRRAPSGNNAESFLSSPPVEFYHTYVVSGPSGSAIRLVIGIFSSLCRCDEA